MVEKPQKYMLRKEKMKNYSIEEFDIMTGSDISDAMLREYAYRLYQKTKNANPEELNKLLNPILLTCLYLECE